jgi:F-type H+-transporting ATPase subunit a
MILVAALINVCIIRRTWKSLQKNNSITSQRRRTIFEPIILYIRDDIAIPNIGETV